METVKLRFKKRDLLTNKDVLCQQAVKTWIEGSKQFFSFGFNKPLLTEIKMMKGSKWHGFDTKNPRKVWSVQVCPRNDFQLRYLKGEDPYAKYDAPLEPFPMAPRFNKAKGKEIPPFAHQPIMAAHMYQRRQCILGGQTGIAKTLAAIAVIERASDEFKAKHKFSPTWFYVAPRSALRGVQRDFMIWGARYSPIFMTYEEMKSRLKKWKPTDPAPFGVIFDESQKVKSQTSQRSEAAQYLADSVRAEWGDDGYVLLMTGTPAPKSPIDWYSQCEIACPGFLKEGDIYKFKNSLAIIIQKKSVIDGGMYPQIVSWRDDEKKCAICGAYQEEHDVQMLDLGVDAHAFEPSVNEVFRLYKRLKGLVEVFWKKDCLDLPEKHYKKIVVKPTPSTLRAAKLIAKSAKTTIDGLIKLRELSDGFQYQEVKDGTRPCPRCHGTKESLEYFEIPGTCPTCKDGIPEGVIAESEFAKPQCPNHLPEKEPKTVSCPECGGSGEVAKYIRTMKEVECPKDAALKDLLDEYEEVGRIVIFAGFTGAIDRVCRICQSKGWYVIRLDQGKEQFFNDRGTKIEIKDYQSMFLDDLETYPNVALVAHPASGGTGLTLTTSPVAVYFSNDYVGENRMQSEDRIHRPGMDYAKGATIVDIIHLPSDEKVLANLQKKVDLQSLSLGELKTMLDEDSELERTI